MSENRGAAVRYDSVQKSYDGETLVVKNLNLDIARGEFLTMLGPSGSGKTTCLMMLAGFEPATHGEIYLNDNPINNVPPHKRGIGMVFQRPNPFPKSIYDNVGYGVKLHTKPTGEELDAIIEKSLKRAAIWDEVSDRMHDLGTSLSGGQQQRLCIARTIAVEPDIILMDEPCSALDPIATAAIEELILELKKDFTVVIVTHSMSQAARVSDYTGFMYLGRLVEFGETDKIFSDPELELTKRYVTGRFG